MQVGLAPLTSKEKVRSATKRQEKDTPFPRVCTNIYKGRGRRETKKQQVQLYTKLLVYFLKTLFKSRLEFLSGGIKDPLAE